MTSMEIDDWDYDAAYQSIAASGSPQELKTRRIACQKALLNQLHVIPIEEWMVHVNTMHDAVARRAVTLSEAQMIEAGYGPPPCAYSFIVFGSAGREESTLWSDQDNGLIIEGEPEEAKKLYFEEFGSVLSAMLEQAGYEKCEGKVMCSEPLWCKTLQEWKEQLASWSSTLEWEPIRYLIISSDMRHIAGDQELSKSWLDYFHEGFQGNDKLLAAVLRNTVRHKATLNLLGQVLTERFGDNAGGFDVKYGLYIPLVNGVRYFSLQNGIRETSTLKRLKSLSDEFHHLPEGVHKAFLTALSMRSSTPFTELDGLLTGSDYTSENELKSRQLMSDLRKSLLLVRRIHRILQRQLRLAERRQL
ncbi:putative nucleotidyltransferase substrate binding domain protein [compost metagenome]